MSSIKEMTCPFEGDDFVNLACSVCKIRPSELNYMADGIDCTRCRIVDLPTREQEVKELNRFYTKSRYVQLNDDARIVLEYSKVVDDFLCGN